MSWTCLPFEHVESFPDFHTLGLEFKHSVELRINQTKSRADGFLGLFECVLEFDADPDHRAVVSIRSTFVFHPATLFSRQSSDRSLFSMARCVHLSDLVLAQIYSQLPCR